MSSLGNETPSTQPARTEERIAVHTETFEISENALGKDLPARYYLDWHFVGVVIGCIFENNSQILPYVLSANAIPVILADIGPSNNAVWINICYTLAVAASLLVSGRLSDVFGRRWFVIGANFSNMLGCIIAATAKNVETIVGGMAFVGLGAAVQVSFPTVISELVPKKHRPIWVGLLYSTSIAPYGFGPVITQELIHSDAGWRWCFYLGIIVAAIATGAFALCYYPPDFQMLHVHRSRSEQVKRQDFVGMALFVGGLVMFLIGLNWGGIVYPWKSGRVVGTIVAGFITLVIFAGYEVFFSQDKILPTHLFKARGYLAMTVCASVGTCVAFSMAVLWPQQVHALLPSTPTKQGLLTSVQGCGTLAGFMFAGIAFHFIRKHRPMMVISCVLMAGMAGAMASVRPNEEHKAPVLIAFLGFAIGVVETAARALIPMSCPDEDIGAALGAMGSLGYALASVATAIYTAILQNKVENIVPKKVMEVGVDAGFNSSQLTSLMKLFSTSLTDVPGIDNQTISNVQLAVAEGYADSFSYVWYAALGFALCALIASLFTPSYGEYYTDDIARKMQHTTTTNRHKTGDELKPSTDMIEKVA